MFGNECCLSTGEVIKVIGFKIKKLIASICENNEDSQFSAKVELPLNFPGIVFHEYMFLRNYNHLFAFYLFTVFTDIYLSFCLSCQGYNFIRWHKKWPTHFYICIPIVLFQIWIEVIHVIMFRNDLYTWGHSA